MTACAICGCTTKDCIACQWCEPALRAERAEGMSPYDEGDSVEAQDEVADLVVQNNLLREALAVYADHRNWGIMRDEFRHPSAVWIGPGATETPVPDAPKVAREALS